MPPAGLPRRRLQNSKRMCNWKQTQFAMDEAGIGIHWVDSRTGKFLYLNEQAAAMLYTVAEMLQLRIPDIDPEFHA